MGMTRNLGYCQGRSGRKPIWSRIGSTLNRWLWAVVCCGIPGVPCFHCSYCKNRNSSNRNTANQRIRIFSTLPTSEASMQPISQSRPRRPHAPGRRKSTPELLTAVRCALTQLEGEPAPAPDTTHPVPLPPKDITQPG